MKTSCIVSGVLLAASACLTGCEDHRDSPNAVFPDRIEFTAARQYPEGIAYSAQLDRFIITSITQGKIGTVSTTGVYEDLLTDPALISGIGVKVGNGRILVCNGDQGVSVKSKPETAFQLAELLVFDLTTRQLTNRVDLDNLLPGVRHFANDLAVDPQNNVYVTDSFAPVIYKVAPDGTPSILVNDTRLGAPMGMFGMNGIIYHPGGYLIAVKTSEGKLFKIDLNNGNAITEVGGLTLQGGDGITLVGTTDLYIVTNSGSQVSLVRSTDNFATASLVRNDTNGYAQATTNVLVNNSIFTLNARIGEVGAAAMAMNPGQLQSNQYSIQKFR
ncbi:gluconolaconase [Spirosoma sordidisoli]|uniref:Gluconolaconase n=1 Tax=Spirosoma sordidisoli TaxID=2502893 RepID=A0A4Q2UTR6_9BACT|nr:gluconolaconase [Spirosoma sordidisoli]RYC71341.1 gluconolaconase [Spirosoma sordidisoli]